MVAPGSVIGNDGWMSDIDTRLVDAGRAFVAAAWPVLQEQRVVPPSMFHPYVEVGRDYFGDALMSLPAYRKLEEAIEAAHPRFRTDVPASDRVFAGGYIFSFLEAFIARLAIEGEEFSPDGPAAEQTLLDLTEAIHCDTFEVACCRVVSHMATVDDQPLEFTDVQVVPVIAQPSGHSRQRHKIISDVISGAASAYSRVPPDEFAPPESVIVTRDSSPKPFDLSEPLSERIEQFLLLVRLLKAGTSESMFEVRGETHPVRTFTPILERFRGAGPGLLSPTQLAASVITLEPDDVSRVDGLARLLTTAQANRRGTLITSFGMALHKFVLSYHAYVWWEQIVDLATAFEAAMSGTSKEDVTLRLRTRAAALLATDRDPAESIFKDISVLYGIRSTLVHGGELKTKHLQAVQRLSTVPDNARDGELPAYAVERLRDLVRRSLLARICLAANALWPLGKDDHVDSILVASDTGRADWRTAWHGAMASIDPRRN